MKIIRKLTIIFENCESITFSENEIGNLTVAEISEEIRRIASNCLANVKTAKIIQVEILPLGNREFESLDTKQNTFDRIKKYKDITALEFCYDSGEIETICVEYNCDNPFEETFENNNQKIEETETNSLLITISNKEN